MYKASQEALYQATNQQLVTIRQQEIDYYTSVNAAIGSQAALIGGFTYGIFTQNQPNADHYYSDRMLTGYYIASTITIACAIHVIVNTMLLQVMGPGLALNGPVGSMARAAEGMKFEQDQVIYAFSIMMIFFSIATACLFWAVMDDEAAITSTIVLAIAARFWYVCSRRVYLRLFWNREDSWVDQMRNIEKDPNGDKPNMVKPDVELTSWNQKSLNEEDEEESADETQGEGKKKKKKFFSKLFTGKISSDAEKNSSQKESKEGEQTDNNSSSNSVKKTNGTDGNKVAMQGYLVKRKYLEGSTAKVVSSTKWERRYFVLLQNGFIYYYNSRQEYRDDPTNTLKERPLELDEFKVLVFRSNSDQMGDDDNVSVVSGMTSASASNKLKGEIKMIFQIELIPADDQSRRWSLRCDTEEELDAWVEVMQEVSPKSFENIPSNSV